MPASDLSWALPPDLEMSVRSRIADFRRQDTIRRIWAADPSVWSGADEDRWLGWLSLPTTERPSLERLARFSEELSRDQIANVVLLGMGGSSLAPEVIRSILGRSQHSPDLHVVDSTDPDQILSVERRIDLSNSVFLVASKSGSTLEVNILKQYFFFRSTQQLGESEAARHFVLTTDPGSKLQQIAEQERFREIFPGVPSVGGRYSALSNFGMVPAVAMGADVSLLLERAEEMAHLCAADVEQNSAFQLGVLLGVAAAAGRDKPTLVAPAALSSFGSWLEQLIAESIGKQGKGIIPIDGEPPGPPDFYGDDRVFVQLRSASAPDAAADEHVDRLQRAGHPVVRIVWADRYSLGAEFFRWEFATAVMGAVLGINPFDQPDVEESKVVTRRLAAEYEKTGKLPEEEPLLQENGMALFADEKNRRALGDRRSVTSYLNAFLDELRPHDYFALLAFIEMNESHTRALQSIRGLVRDRTRVATTVGFGPRFLHSTGQAHKGGPNSGVFLQITADNPHDLPVPGQRYSFGTIKLAQARGDFEVLASRGRRALRVHLTDIERGLQSLHAAIRDALSGVQ
jgi:transaldolase / glucose-6-phosphate isomerase